MMPSGAVFQERLRILWVVLYCGVAALGIRLVQVQVLRNVYYTKVAERNRTQVIYQTAPRGRIYDRNGDVIATNRPTFSLIYLPSKKEGGLNLQGLAADLSEEINRGREALAETLNDAVREQAAIHLAENLPLKAMFKLSEIKTIYPGVDLIVESQRHYPRGAFASHLLGYLGKLDRPAWLSLRGNGYRLDSRVGRTGIEKLFERELRGVDGEIRMEVDAQGHIKRFLDQIPGKAGGNISLNLDARLQAAAEDALRASPSGRGAAVVMDPRNGEVLAFASVPDYDPNQFLQTDKDGVRVPLEKVPEFNLAISGTYPPGSTFKIVTSAALLNENKMSPQEKFHCSGSYKVGNRVFRCWEKKGHGYQDWLDAITHSCDVYFYHAGLRIGGETLERYERMFGLGEETHIALTGEKRGNRFGPQARASRGKSWYDGDSANLAIGQGELLVTPIQMAVLISAVANRGTLWRPQFTRRIEYAEGGVYEQKPEALGQITLKDRTWDLLQQGLLRVVEAGTGVGVRVPGVSVAGKTGTAENPHGDDHAWFVAFAGKPGEAPSLALSVLVQHGGHGSSAAGPVARKIIETAFTVTAPQAGLVSAEPHERRSPVVEEVPEAGLQPLPQAAPKRPQAEGQGPAAVQAPLKPPRAAGAARGENGRRAVPQPAQKPQVLEISE